MVEEDGGNHCYHERRSATRRRLESIIDAKILRELLPVLLPFLFRLPGQRHRMTSLRVIINIHSRTSKYTL